MVIQTEVTLQPDNVLSACDGEKILHCRNCYFITFPAYPMVKSSTILNPCCVIFYHKVAPLDATAPYIDTSVSEQISICSVWSNGTMLVCRAPNLPSLPVCRVVYPFFTTSTRLPVF